MEIVPLTKNLNSKWNRFCLGSDEAWFWHTIDWIDYLLIYGLSDQTKSLSFFIVDSKEILAVCPLLISQNKKVKEIFCRGFSLDSPALSNKLNKKRRLEILKMSFNHVDKIAKEYRVARSVFKISPETKNFLSSRKIPFNFLDTFGFINTSGYTKILDLLKSESELWSDIKKKQRYEINKAKRYFRVKILTNKNITLKIIKQYQTLHQKAAGRKTRPNKTFLLMLSWIKKRRAILLNCLLKDKPIGFVLINIYKNSAYYHSACNHPKFIKKPIGHLLQWEAIRWLKNNGFQFYNIGEQKITSQIYSLPTEKEINISYFKGSFGGRTYPFYIGEKYYSKNYFLKMFNKRIKEYAKKI